MRVFKEVTILDGASATGAGTALPVKDFRHCMFSVATDGDSDADFTIKFQGAISDGATANQSPDFDSGQTAANMWDYIEVVDLNDGSAIDGDTGITKAGADDYRILEANINGLKYLTANITAHSKGDITVKLLLLTDD